MSSSELSPIEEIYRKLRNLSEETEVLSQDNDFFNKAEQKDLITIGKRLAKHLHESQIGRIAFLDKSARLAYLCLIEAWHKMYPGEMLPEIYFLNPTGFNTVNEMITEIPIGGGHRLPVILALAAKELPSNVSDSKREQLLEEKIGEVIEIFLHRTEDIVQGELQSDYKRLVADKDSPLMIFDTCIHSGMSFGPVLNALKKAGLTDLRIGLASDSRNYSDLEPDFIALDEEAHGGCYPFEKGSMVQKKLDSLVSSPNKDKEDRARGMKLRKEIKKIFEIGWKN